jgi:hypothetical protein
MEMRIIVKLYSFSQKIKTYEEAKNQLKKGLINQELTKIS